MAKQVHKRIGKAPRTRLFRPDFWDEVEFFCSKPEAYLEPKTPPKKVRISQETVVHNYHKDSPVAISILPSTNSRVKVNISRPKDSSPRAARVKVGSKARSPSIPSIPRVARVKVGSKARSPSPRQEKVEEDIVSGRSSPRAARVKVGSKARSPSPSSIPSSPRAARVKVGSKARSPSPSSIPSSPRAARVKVGSKARSPSPRQEKVEEDIVSKRPSFRRSKIKADSEARSPSSREKSMETNRSPSPISLIKRKPTSPTFITKDNSWLGNETSDQVSFLVREEIPSNEKRRKNRGSNARKT